MQVRDVFAPLLRPQGLLIAAANTVPILGVLIVGWDAATIVILYWMETAIIGFWAIIRVVIAPKALVAALPDPKPANISGIGLGLFVLAHAGIFMAVHLFFLEALMPGEWRRHLGDPARFVLEFIIPTGLWLPLAGLFLVRGLITVSEIRAGHAPGPAVFGFYARIIVMQFVVLLGGFASALLGSQVLLICLVIIKTLIDLNIDRLVVTFQHGYDRARARAEP